MKNDPELLRLMVDDQDRHDPIYGPGPYWRPYQNRMIKAIARNGIENFRGVPSVGKGYADTVTLNPRDVWHDPYSFKSRIKNLATKLVAVKPVIKDYRTLLGSRDIELERVNRWYYRAAHDDWFSNISKTFSIPDSMHGGCLQSITMGNGQIVSKKYLDLLMRLDSFGAQVDFRQVRCAFEIGGGFGAWPHLMVSMFPNVRKFAYLDIPPMLYVATQYLRHFFGESVIDYRATQNTSDIRFSDNDDLEIICICPWQIENLNIDAELFWNVASFSEMTPDIVENYANFLKGVLNQDKSNVCLVLNKEQPLPGVNITMPSEILAAFSPEFQFDDFSPRAEHPEHAQYWFGKRSGDTAS